MSHHETTKFSFVGLNLVEASADILSRHGIKKTHQYDSYEDAIKAMENKLIKLKRVSGQPD